MDSTSFDKLNNQQKAQYAGLVSQRLAILSKSHSDLIYWMHCLLDATPIPEDKVGQHMRNEIAFALERAEDVRTALKLPRE